MPTLAFYSSREVFNALNSAREDAETTPRQELMRDLRQLAAYEFAKLGMTLSTPEGPTPMNVSGVTARWFIYDDHQNEVSIEIMVLFSTSEEDFLPNKEQLRALGRELTWALRNSDILSDQGFNDGGVWTMPQHGAEYQYFLFPDSAE